MRGITRAILWFLVALICFISRPVASEPQGASGVTVDKASIGGVVLNAKTAKPEAGVWVIAETKLSVPYRKIVVTDDQGRFLVPDLPDASYELWVRGYGLKDSEKVKAARGDNVKLRASTAETPQEAAKIYPASYWTSMIHPPAKEELPKGYASQEQWLAAFRGGCNQCHQLGMTVTRRYTTADDWDSVWKRNDNMSAAADRLGRELLEKTMVDWGTRIQNGEVPPQPPRPTGIERNFVVTQWDWGTRESFFHDVTSTDKRNPTMYAYGKVYGADRTGGGVLWVLDPVKNTIEAKPVVPRNAKGYSTKVDYYHERESEEAWMASPHNPMLDENGRVWMTQPTRPPGAENNPKWSASTIAMDTNDPQAQAIASKALLSRSHGMQLGYFDTNTNKFVGVDTSYNTHHLQFDWQDRIWTDGDVLGELDTKKLDLTNPESNEAGAEHAWMRVDMDSKKVIPTNGYATAVSPVDGNVWLSVPVVDGPQNKLYMLDPTTNKFKDYLLPPPGRLSHGIDFSTDGTVWFSAGSGHLGRLDPKTGQFKYWDLPGPKFTGTGAETGSTEYPYFLWVDQFDTLGLGKNTVIVTGTTSDSMLIFDPKKETFTVFRMAYPMPFYTRGLDGRIDDAKAGWKGRGIWATYSSYMPKFTETRLGSVNHIQLRPNPLAN
jgi:mono/diheme cytochrome c family protein